MSARVAYILAQYPCRSELFIEREIKAVRRRGISVDVYAVRVGEGSEPTTGVTYRASVPFAEKLAALLWAAARPAKLAKALAGIVAEKYSRPTALARSLRNVPISAAWARRISRSGAEHLHAHFLGEPGTIARTVSYLVTIPYSLSVHARDIFVDTAASADTIKHAAAVAACTLAAAKRARELLPADQCGKVHVIRHGIEAAADGSGEPGPREAVVLAVGRLVEKKGIPVLLGAMRRILRTRPVRCVIVGDGPDRPSIERQACELGVAEAVHLAGWQPPEEVGSWMRRASVLAVPSIVAADGDREGLPNVILEAACAGLPIVASETGGIAEFIVNGQTGLLVPPGNEGALAAALERLMDNNALREAIVANARKKVRREYDADTNAAALIEAMGWKQ